MHRWRTVVLTLGVSAILALLGGLLFIYAGIYNVAALDQHGRIMNWLLHSVALNSIERRAQAVAIPPLNDPGRLKRGLSLYRQDCVQCHGGPGEAPASFAMGFMPGAPPLIQVAKEWPANEIYWAVRNGIKMTAMPPWHYRMTDDEVWDVVAFVETLPTLSLADYKTQAAAASASASDGKETAPGPAMTGDIDRGKVALGQYACAACHTIPGIVAPPGHVGPTLAGMSQRSVIAGLLANTPEDMVAWIRHPQTISPGTAMPDMGVSAQDAGDMAAYLTSLK